MTPKEIVSEFWKAMASNDFFAGAEWLAEDFVLLWPQSGEKIIGRKNFAELNTNYPANGPWRFKINAMLCEGNVVVTDVDVTDGTIQARAITFHTVENDRIVRQVEFWPEPFEAPEWRREWIEF